MRPLHLRIIHTPDSIADNNAQRFAAALKRACANKKITTSEITVKNDYTLFQTLCASSCYMVPTVIMEPCNLDRPEVYLDADKNATARVIRDICRKYEHNHVLILNRSKLIGRPLADMLLDDDFTVMIAHTKSEVERLLPAADIVVTATGTQQDYNFSDKMVIDVSGDYKGESLLYVGMAEIGRRTVEKIIEGVESYARTGTL